MKIYTISQVSKLFGVSTRMLRYYEGLGLVSSKRTTGYSYRDYDENDCKRIKQILILRKLIISLKEIKKISDDPSSVNAIEIFINNATTLDD